MVGNDGDGRFARSFRVEKSICRPRDVAVAIVRRINNPNQQQAMLALAVILFVPAIAGF
jgi:hypothetical protein